MTSMGHRARTGQKKYANTVSPIGSAADLIAEKDAQIAALQAELAAARATVKPRRPRWINAYVTAMYAPRWCFPTSIHADVRELNDDYTARTYSTATMDYLLAEGLVERHPEHRMYALTDKGYTLAETLDRDQGGDAA